MTMFFVKHNAGVTVMLDGKSHVVSNTSSTYSKLMTALAEKNKSLVKRYVSAATAVSEMFTGSKRIKIEAGIVLFKTVSGDIKQVEGPIVDRILAALKTKNPEKTTQPLVAFLDNINKNKIKDIRDELYAFLKSGDMPITSDGCFLAYKKIRYDYMDIYTGTMNNSPGKVVAMQGDLVDKDRNKTCSVGLHFCSKSYLAAYSSFGLPSKPDKIVVVKVNPRHVFAIPNDYNNAKGRASEYYVVGEIDNDLSLEKTNHFLDSFVFQETLEDNTSAVKFKAPLKAGITAQATGYGFIDNGKVHIRIADSNGKLLLNKRTVVKLMPDGTFMSAITGKPVPIEHVVEFSATTKSVRPLLVRAVAKARNK